ncbi:class I SAM-dependent methyltransferase [Candidatus Gottesmanbacteria bacterium]|nr:class I SAM-dependent methyltransferase [Candidatus Gottesmanbacteria bacterium]
MARKRYIYHKGDDAFAIASMKKYLKKQEMDKLLEKLIKPVIAGKKLKILDAGCGVGHVSGLLSALSPRSAFTGVDQTPLYITTARQLYRAENLAFEVGDLEDLPSKYPKGFDVAVSRAVISWIPYYTDFMRALVKVAKKHIFLSSLFYEGDIDFITKVREFKKESGKEDFNAYYNVYSIPHFKEFMRSLGAKKVKVTDFDIGIDLPRGPVDHMGTYTEKLKNGKRLQISGAVVMSWKWLRIDL